MPQPRKNEHRYVSMPISERTYDELYGLQEALEDYLEAATDPEYAAYRDLLAIAGANTEGWYVLRGADKFKSGREAAEEYFEAREVVVEVVIPTVFTLGDEEYNLNHRYLTTGDEEALLQLAWSILGRVEARIRQIESPTVATSESVPAAQ